MQIKDVENLAEMARIELTDDEKKAILKDMGGILEYVKQIEGVDVGDVESEASPRNVWREDLPAQAGEVVPRDFDKDLITGQFPDSQDGFLKVKKIL